MRVRTEKAFRREFGQNLKAARKARGLSQKDVAERAAIADKYLSRVELGAATPSVLIASKIAQALGVGVDALIGVGRSKEDPVVTGIVASVHRLGPQDLACAARMLDALVRSPPSVA